MHKIVDRLCALGVQDSAMHLADYMAERDLSDEDVAAAIGRSRVSVSRYRRKLVRPDWDTIEEIRAFTRGKVTEADWRRIGAGRLQAGPRAARVA